MTNFEPILRPSLYTKISKEIGHSPRLVSLPPTLAEAERLAGRAKLGDISAFRQLFMIWRFYPSPRAGEDFNIFQRCLEVFLRAENYYREKYD